MSSGQWSVEDVKSGQYLREVNLVGEIKSFRDLEVWKKADELAHFLFDLTETFPKSYLYDLTNQLRRSVLSVPTNIVEGSASRHTKELIQSLNISKKSLAEAEYLLFFAYKRKLISCNDFDKANNLCEETRKMIIGLLKSLLKGY